MSHKSRLSHVFALFLVFALLGSWIGTAQAEQPRTGSPTQAPPAAGAAVAEAAAANTTALNSVFLPVIQKPPAKFYGIYLDRYWNNTNVKTYMPLADQAAGKKHAAVGWFIGLEDTAFTIPVTYLPGNNLYSQLEELWKSGYISFINVDTTVTSAQIVSGVRDTNIRYAARFYKAWLDLGEGRKAMIAPLQEMNGNWTPYGKYSTSEDVKKAYRHIVDIFYQEGVRRDQVWWVFAPNAWNPVNEPQRAFENYYPGDDVVDFVGFSSYNYGYCPSTVSVSAKWESYREIFEPHIKRMKVMAPSKPVIIAETATTAYYDYDKADQNRKNQWLIESYQFLAANPDVVGIFYFSFTEFDNMGNDTVRRCDFEVAQKDKFSTGYRDGLSQPIYRYMTVPEIEHFVP